MGTTVHEDFAPHMRATFEDHHDAVLLLQELRGIRRAESARSARWQAEAFRVVGVLRLLHVVVHRLGPRQERHVFDAIRRVDQLPLVVGDPRRGTRNHCRPGRPCRRAGRGVESLAGLAGVAGSRPVPSPSWRRSGRRGLCHHMLRRVASNNAVVPPDPAHLAPINALRGVRATAPYFRFRFLRRCH